MSAILFIGIQGEGFSSTSNRTCLAWHVEVRGIPASLTLVDGVLLLAGGLPGGVAAAAAAGELLEVIHYGWYVWFGGLKEDVFFFRRLSDAG